MENVNTSTGGQAPAEVTPPGSPRLLTPPHSPRPMVTPKRRIPGPPSGAADTSKVTTSPALDSSFFANSSVLKTTPAKRISKIPSAPVSNMSTPSACFIRPLTAEPTVVGSLFAEVADGLPSHLAAANGVAASCFPPTGSPDNSIAFAIATVTGFTPPSGAADTSKVTTSPALDSSSLANSSVLKTTPAKRISKIPSAPVSNMSTPSACFSRPLTAEPTVVGSLSAEVADGLASHLAAANGVAASCFPPTGSPDNSIASAIATVTGFTPAEAASAVPIAQHVDGQDPLYTATPAPHCYWPTPPLPAVEHNEDVPLVTGIAPNANSPSGDRLTTHSNSLANSPALQPSPAPVPAPATACDAHSAPRLSSPPPPPIPATVCEAHVPSVSHISDMHPATSVGIITMPASKSVATSTPRPSPPPPSPKPASVCDGIVQSLNDSDMHPDTSGGNFCISASEALATSTPRPSSPPPTPVHATDCDANGQSITNSKVHPDTFGGSITTQPSKSDTTSVIKLPLSSSSAPLPAPNMADAKLQGKANPNQGLTSNWRTALSYTFRLTTFGTRGTAWLYKQHLKYRRTVLLHLLLVLGSSLLLGLLTAPDTRLALTDDGGLCGAIPGLHEVAATCLPNAAFDPTVALWQLTALQTCPHPKATVRHCVDTSLNELLAGSPGPHAWRLRWNVRRRVSATGRGDNDGSLCQSVPFAHFAFGFCFHDEAISATTVGYSEGGLLQQTCLSSTAPPLCSNAGLDELLTATPGAQAAYLRLGKKITAAARQQENMCCAAIPSLREAVTLCLPDAAWDPTLDMQLPASLQVCGTAPASQCADTSYLALTSCISLRRASAVRVAEQASLPNKQQPINEEEAPEHQVHSSHGTKACTEGSFACFFQQPPKGPLMFAAGTGLLLLLSWAGCAAAIRSRSRQDMDMDKDLPEEEVMTFSSSVEHRSVLRVQMLGLMPQDIPNNTWLSFSKHLVSIKNLLKQLPLIEKQQRGMLNSQGEPEYFTIGIRVTGLAPLEDSMITYYETLQDSPRYLRSGAFKQGCALNEGLKAAFVSFVKKPADYSKFTLYVRGNGNWEELNLFN